jgi:hypothetical protein
MSLTKVGGILSASLTGINYPVTSVEYLVVAGGGGGGSDGGAGGGAGGLLTATGLAVTIGSSITVTVGAGGVGGTGNGSGVNGSNSVFSPTATSPPAGITFCWAGK